LDLSLSNEILLAIGLFFGAALYSSVGHAGASAYLALMALFNIPPVVMRPTALALNICVASLGSYRYISAGLFRWRTVWPPLIGAVPMAFLGGSIQLPGEYYKPLVGVVLVFAALRLLIPNAWPEVKEIREMPIWLGILAGVAIGFLAGLTGTGGGIFLSPLILFFGFAETRQASGIAAVFILCNSIAGLAGNFAAVQSLPAHLPLFIAAVLAGGWVGTELGIRRFATPMILRALGLVLLVASWKLLSPFVIEIFDLDTQPKP
jgi:uncharacterized protein